jgi:hypothetical protein
LDYEINGLKNLIIKISSLIWLLEIDWLSSLHELLLASQLLNSLNVKLFIKLKVLHLLIVKHPEVLFGHVFFCDASIPHRPGKKSTGDGAHS